MAIEIYHGQYITAEDATKKIDMPTIQDGCRMLKEASDNLEQLSRKIDILRETCNREAISVGGKNMEELIETYEANTKKFSEYIDELSNSLNATTQRVVNRKQTILNEEARRLDEKEALLHNNRLKQELKEGDILKSPPTNYDAVYNEKANLWIKNKPTDYDSVYNPTLGIEIKNKPTDYDAVYHPNQDLMVKNNPAYSQTNNSSTNETLMEEYE